MVIKRDYKIIADCVKQCEGTSFTIELAHNMVGNLNLGIDECDIKNYIDSRMSRNEISEIMNLSRPEVSPTLYGLLQKCQATSASVERSFSMLKKLLAKDRNFLPENIPKYFKLYYNKSAVDEI